MNKQNNDYHYLSVLTDEHQSLFILDHPLFTAKISEFGGQLLSFKPTGCDELIWLSDSAVMDTSKAIRGGAPICWPWFGPAPDAFSGEPQHGYARMVKWELDSLVESDSEVKLTLVPKFPAEFEQTLNLGLSLEYTFSETASIAVITTNNGNKDFELSLAIHTYLTTTDVSSIKIPELINCQYIDKLANQLTTQTEPFSATNAMDRVYLYDKPSVTVYSEEKTIALSNEGHDSLVVWNPWQEGAIAMADFDDLGYQTMLCVETALTQGFKLIPGATHRLEQRIKVNAS